MTYRNEKLKEIEENIIKVEIHKTISSEPDSWIFETQYGKFRVSSDELLNSKIFIKRYFKTTMQPFPEFNIGDWFIFLETCSKKAIIVSSKYISDTVFFSKLFVEEIRGYNLTKNPSKAASDSHCFLEVDGMRFLRIKYILSWLKILGYPITIHEFSTALEDLGVKIEDTFTFNFDDSCIPSKLIGWLFDGEALRNWEWS